MFKNCCVLRKNNKKIIHSLEDLGYFFEGTPIKRYIVITHGVYGYADDNDFVRFEMYCDKNNIEDFYIDCGTDEEKFLRLAEEEM